jgi:heptosyltransferase-3
VTKASAPSFLIVCLRFLGDVLATTPLAYSIKTHLPSARVDYLVFAGTEGILARNPFVDGVITMPRGSRSLALIASLWNQYDVALSTNPSDRMTVFSAIAGKKSYGLLRKVPGEWWKEPLLDGSCRYDDRNHVVQVVLSLLDMLNIPKRPRVVVGFDAEDERIVREKLAGGPYVVLHPYSRAAFKFWDERKWAELAGMIRSRLKLRPVFTVAPDLADQALLRRIADAASTPIEKFADPFSLNQLAAAIKGSVAYVGIDTAVTHIAAATGSPVIALYGPTLTRYWAPWPNDCGEASPFAANKGIQRKGNVTVIQKDWGCVPCNKETCAITTRQKIECLEAITPDEVLRELANNVG